MSKCAKWRQWLCRNVTPFDIAHPRQIHLRLRANRPSIVWLAARRQGRFALLPFDFHLDDARFAVTGD
ncbi:MAG: hypothetical protein DME23_19420 [Verrucomicrobia bacterium]|nr:MAG: hypothetical protein DME23_19420 [Verrucomicrobiota bacterium]